MGIKVRLQKVESLGQFEIRYLNRVKTLAITKEGEKKWNYGIALDGILLLDTDETKELVNIELMAAKSGWKRSRIENPFRSERFGSLFLPEIDNSHEYEQLSVQTRFDTEKHCLQILVQDEIDSAQCYRLGKGFDVMLNGDILAGFQLTPASGVPYLFGFLTRIYGRIRVPPNMPACPRRFLSADRCKKRRI